MDIRTKSAELISEYGRMGIAKGWDEPRPLRGIAAKASSNLFPANLTDGEPLLAAAVYLLGEWLDTDCEP